MGNQEEVECGCEFGTVSEDTREMVREELEPGEDLEQALECFRKRDEDSRTGHFKGCPIDVQAYESGEFYCHSDFRWANSFLIQRSNGMLELGPMNSKAPNYELFKNQGGMTGVYRKKG
tara:strand:- start:248 stop:604 length:357 start_codon:yes stop_codon:yes gene_type:complete